MLPLYPEPILAVLTLLCTTAYKKSAGKISPKAVRDQRDAELGFYKIGVSAELIVQLL